MKMRGLGAAMERFFCLVFAFISIGIMGNTFGDAAFGWGFNLSAISLFLSLVGLLITSGKKTKGWFDSHGSAPLRHPFIRDPLLVHKMHVPCRIEYADANGEVTIREVTVTAFYGYKRRSGVFINYIFGFCHLRREDRTFAVHRILKIEFLEGGFFVEGKRSIQNALRGIGGYETSDEGVTLEKAFDPARKAIIDGDDGRIFEVDVDLVKLRGHDIEVVDGIVKMTDLSASVHGFSVRANGKSRRSGRKNFHSAASISIPDANIKFDDIREFVKHMLSEDVAPGSVNKAA